MRVQTKHAATRAVWARIRGASLVGKALMGVQPRSSWQPLRVGRLWQPTLFNSRWAYSSAQALCTDKEVT